jgi:hydrogenase maturation protease
MNGQAAPRVLVAGVGNVLRQDDGFGPAVLATLGAVPDGVRLLESGIGGMALLHEIMDGWDGLIVLDAVDRGASPGTVFVIDPKVDEPHHVPDIHLANPQRVLMMARGLEVLPPRVLLVGCQPEDCDTLDQRLSAPVQRAVPVAVRHVHEILRSWLATPLPR